MISTGFHSPAPNTHTAGQQVKANVVGAAVVVVDSAVDIAKNPFETEIEPHECVCKPFAVAFNCPISAPVASTLNRDLAAFRLFA
jgi:hypothetical protein